MNHRYISRIIIQAETPLIVASGDSSFSADDLVVRDWNNMPMIPGTSLLGVLRHSIENQFPSDSNNWKEIFGYGEENSKDGLGARFRISHAYMLLDKSYVSEGYVLDPKFSILQNIYSNLPIRNHVRINSKGVKEDGGLFNNEVIFKGTKFIFEIEFIGNKVDNENWKILLNQINSSHFRIGSGTRKGYGKLKIEEITYRVYDLNTESDFIDYLSHSPKFSIKPKDFKVFDDSNENNYAATYILELKQDNSFFHFGGGIGDEEVDNTPTMEEIAEYDEHGVTIVKQKCTLIPASSIKGAISHRTAFHYNKLINKWANDLNISDKKNRDLQVKMLTGTFNEAVYELFGSEAGVQNRAFAQRGHVMIDDVYIEEKCIDNSKIFNHVAIDRFTGGALDSALFSEKVSTMKNNNAIKLEISLTKKFECQVLTAFEEALKDICDGLLPLGGMTTKGHGIFTGTISLNNKNIYEYGNRYNEGSDKAV